jgi:tetratricopeptide (TPR) repeat protein
MLKLAICKYRYLLREPQGPGPDESRAMLQYSLGAALQTLGESEAATARLNEAVEVYNQAKLTLETPGNPQAAEAQKRTRRTLELAATLNNRASAKKSIADREGNSGLLRQALDDLDQARKELGEQRGPYVQELRAKILVNRGNAQRRLGEMEKNPDCLAVAEEAYEEAIKILIAEQSTLELASTTTCLANVLQTRGRMERSKILLDRAVDAYREVLKVQSSEGTKIDWAVTQNNLADALVELGRMTGSATPLEAALRAYEEALTVRKKKLYPLDWAFTWDGYSNALDALATCTNDRKYREDAIKRLHEAIAVYQQCGVAGDHLMGARERCDTMKKSLESMMAHAVGYS